MGMNRTTHPNDAPRSERSVSGKSEVGSRMVDASPKIIGRPRLGARPKSQRFEWTPERLRMVEDCYRSHHRPPLAELSKKLGISKKCIYERAILLGVTQRGKKPALWSEEEIKIVEKSAHLTVQTTVRRLKHAGFDRSAIAVEMYRKRHIASREDARLEAGVMSAGGLARCLGVESKVVTYWIKKGWLKAQRMEDGGHAEHGLFLIKDRDIRQFIIDYTAHIDLRRTDKYWLIDILIQHAGTKAPGREAA